MRTILILGINGMLGSASMDYLLKDDKDLYIIATYNDKNKFYEILNRYPRLNKNKFINFNILADNVTILPKNIDEVINCIGIIKPFINEKDSHDVIRATKVNSIFPHILADYYKNSKIYQIATDCVFSGREGNYTELSPHDCTDIYGKTKSLGEVDSENFFNIRCSIIGHEILSKNSLLEWFLSQKNNEIINGFTNHLWNGVTTKCYFNLIISIIKNQIKIPNLLHIKPLDIINKYELLNIFAKKFKKDLKINKFESEYFCDRSLNTIHEDINELIWNSSIYKKKLSIDQMVEDIL